MIRIWNPMFVMSLFGGLTVYPCGWAQSPGPSVVGQYAPIQSLPYAPVHAALLPTGKVLFWPAFDVGNHPTLWDPITATTVAAPQAAYNIFCAGHSFLANGQLLLTGGDFQTEFGIQSATIYDPVNNIWTEQPDMNAGRWYPTNTTLGNGDVLVVAGEISPSLGNDTLPQVYQAAIGAWRDLTTAQLNQPTYPAMFLTAAGLVFNAGSNQQSRFLNPTGTGGWILGPLNNFGTRDYGPVVMYDDGKILAIGGGDPATNTAEVIDVNAPVPAWRYTNPMQYARRQANAVLLPDGKVLVTGGSNGPGFDDSSYPVYPAEMWDPATENWTILDSLSIYRGYHSTAVLLPDGRVFSGGGAFNNAEVYSPPYLFQGPRPTIASAPSTVVGGQTFFVATPDAANITTVNWLRLGATTHTFDQNQRINHLSFTQFGGGLNVNAPANPNVAPPGDYMLFILQNGVPSVASFINVSYATATASSLVWSPSRLIVKTPITIGSTSAAQTVTLTNLGISPVAIGGIAITGQDFFIAGKSCGTSLAATSSCQISIAEQPTTAGPLSGILTITDSDPASPQIVQLSGAGMALKPSATSFNFGTSALGSTSANLATLTLTNRAPSSIAITGLMYSSAEFSLNAQTSTCGVSIAGYSSCIIYSTFTPNAIGTQTGTLTIASSDPGGPLAVTLTGTGTAVQLTPNHYSWGTRPINLATAPQPITLANLGTVPLNIAGVAITGTNSGSFAIQSNNCGPQVPAGGSCAIAIVFTPAVLGAAAATLTITDDGGGSPQQLALNGTGGTGITSIAVTPANPTVNAGQNQQFTATATYSDGSSKAVTNSANWSSSVASVATVGSANGLATGVASGTANIAATVGIITGATTLTVPVGSTATTITSSSNPSNTGTAVTFTAKVSLSSATGTVQFFDGGASIGTQALTGGTASLTISTLSAASHAITAGYSGDANNSPSTSPALTQVVNGNTPTATSISSSKNPSFAGQPLSFTAAVTPAAATGNIKFWDSATLLSTLQLAAGAATFTTSALSLGNHPIAAVYGGDANNAPSTSPFLSQAIVTSSISVSPAGLTFKSKQTVGTASAPLIVTLTNTGSAGLTISAMTPSGPDFMVSSTNCGPTLASAASCQIGVTFQPAAGGIFAETLSIADSDVSSPQVVALNGVGVALKASSTSFTIGTTVLGTTSVNKATLTLTNSSAFPIAINSLTYSNSEFREDAQSTCSTSIAGNSSCIIYSTFTPNAIGPQPGTLTIVDSDGSSPSVISLNGTGTSVQLTPNHYSWGNRPINLPTASPPITLTNVGSIALNIAGLAITGTNSSSFAIQSNTCGPQVGAGGSCMIALTFSPTVLGPAAAFLTITDDGGGSPQQLSLNGSGGTGITSIVVAPLNPMAAVGSNLQFTATATYSDGSTKAVTNSATWSSSATSVATVGSSGAALGLAACVVSGATTISATVGAIVGSSPLTCQ